MEDLIKALQILLKYGNPHYPTNCEHDILVIDIDPTLVSPEDIIALDELGVYPNEEVEDCFASYRFGSC